MAKIVELQPNRDLINVNFDHYKLSFDSISQYLCDLNYAVDIAKPPENNFSSHHAQIFLLNNSLFPDPWDNDLVYFCDKEWNIGRGNAVQSKKLDVVGSVFKIPDAANLRLRPVRFNVSVKFLDSELAIVADGVSKLYITATGNRKAGKPWKTIHCEEMENSGQVYQLVDAVLRSEGENHRVHCLLASVEEVEGEVKERHNSPYITVLDWITFLSVDKEKWCIERKWRVEGSRPYQYACISQQSCSLYIASSKHYTVVSDSVKPVDNSEPWELLPENKDSYDGPMYTWSQTSSDVTVNVTLPQGLTKANLSVTIKRDYLEVNVKNGYDMIKGNLHAPVTTDSSTWTVENRKLEITLQKESEEMWSELVMNDTRGELVLSQDQIDIIHERLSHLTSEHWNPNPMSGEKAFNVDMLEECDAVGEDGVLIMRLDGDQHRISHKIITSNRLLFCTARDKSFHVPCIALRHDVDAFVWQADETEDGDVKWTHSATLNAFGYVMASKQQCRFSSCSSDRSVAVIADAKRHIYVYRQNVDVLSPLRNRKTGKQVQSVAKQQVLTLDCPANDILGIHVTNNCIFAVTPSKLWLFVTNVE